MRPYIWFLVGSFICASAFSSVNVLIIPTIKSLTDAISSKDPHQLNMLALAIVGLYFMRGLFSFGQKYFAAHADQGITKDLRMRMFEHLQDLSLDFYSQTRTGEIIMVVMNHINIMQTVILDSFTSVIPGVLTLVGISVYLFSMNWKLALLACLMLPFITYLSAKFGRGMRDMAQTSQEKLSDISSMLHEVVTSVKIVKAFTMEKEEIRKFEMVADQMKRLQFRTSVLRAAQHPLFQVTQAVAAVVVIWFGGAEIISGAISPGNLIAFFSGVVMLGEPIAELSGVNIMIQMALISSRRYFNILDTPSTVVEKLNALEPIQIEGRVTYKDVSFKYDKGKNNILHDINIDCRPGEVIAIVGHSGAGKSTLISLIPRLYDVTSGELLIDGRDIKEYKLVSLRKHIGIVPQETLLFSSSIQDNIAYGNVTATEEDVIDASKMANAHDFIMSLPNKYKTLIGEKGIRLSGGERQRVAIARAFLRDPRILILDEATSSLDSESENKVQEALEKLMSGRTTFVIAHRLSTVKFANRIIVLRNGGVVDQGTHDELMKKKGYYRKLHDMQMGNFSESVPNIFGFIQIANEKHLCGQESHISGWVISDDDSEIEKVRLMSKGKLIGKSLVAIARPDVKIVYPNYSNALKSGFAMTVNFDQEKDGLYRLVAVRRDGKIVRGREFMLSDLLSNQFISIV